MERKSIRTVIELTDEQKKNIMSEIEDFYYEVRGEKIGMLEQQQMVDLFMENLAPIVYNKALEDAQRWYKRQMDNLEADYYVLYKDTN